MAFGANEPKNNKKAYAFKIKLKEVAFPYFEVKERDENDKWVVREDDKKVTFLSGSLISVEVKENKVMIAGTEEVIKSVNLTLDGGDEIYFLTVNTNSVGRNLMNSLLSLETYENLTISLYKSKPKEEGGISYSSIALRQNDELVMSKYRYTDLPAPEKVKFKGKTQNDFTEADDFLRAEIEKISAKVKELAKSGVSKPTNDTPDSGSDEAGDDDDVPF